jgi:hypothetical protein
VVVGLALQAIGRIVDASAGVFRRGIEVVHGKLGHHRSTNALFHIGDLWMQVSPGTEFHRWLLRGAGRPATISVTADPADLDDLPNVRILTGRLTHQTAPSLDPVVHILFLRDEVTGALGAVTFETEARIIAAAFDACGDAQIGIVIEIETE